MRLASLNPNYINELLKLEEQMYWQSPKWKDLWQKEAKAKFRAFIKDYLTNLPQGCFGLIENKELLGAMFLTKTSKLKPIPYLHKVSRYFEKEGEIAYVSFFVVKKGKREFEIAQKLYDQAEKVAFFKLKCKTIAVVIYSSPLELKTLQAHNYKKLEKQFKWEIYPGKKVPCNIYYKEGNQSSLRI